MGNQLSDPLVPWKGHALASEHSCFCYGKNTSFLSLMQWPLYRNWVVCSNEEHKENWAWLLLVTSYMFCFTNTCFSGLTQSGYATFRLTFEPRIFRIRSSSPDDWTGVFTRIHLSYAAMSKFEQHCWNCNCANWKSAGASVLEDPSMEFSHLTLLAPL